MPGVSTGTAHWMLSTRTLTGIRRSSTRILFTKSESRGRCSPSVPACWPTSPRHVPPLPCSTNRGPSPATRTYSSGPARIAGAPVPRRAGSSSLDEQPVRALAVLLRRRHRQTSHLPQGRARHRPEDRRRGALVHHRHGPRQRAHRQSASFAVVPAGQYFAACARPKFVICPAATSCFIRYRSGPGSHFNISATAERRTPRCWLTNATIRASWSSGGATVALRVLGFAGRRHDSCTDRPTDRPTFSVAFVGPCNSRRLVSAMSIRSSCP